MARLPETTPDSLSPPLHGAGRSRRLHPLQRWKGDLWDHGVRDWPHGATKGGRGGRTLMAVDEGVWPGQSWSKINDCLSLLCNWYSRSSRWVKFSNWPVKQGGQSLVADWSSCWCPQGLQHLDSQLRVPDRRQQQVVKLQVQHKRLQVELQEVRALLTLQTSRGSGESECYTLSGSVAGLTLAVSQFRVCMLRILLT